MCELDANQSTDTSAELPSLPMETAPAGTMHLGDVLVWPVPDTPDAFHFLPLSPSIVQNSDGTEQVSLIDAGSVAFLQISTQLMMSNSRLEAIRKDLEETAAGPVRLTFARLKDVFPAIVLGEAAATFVPSHLPTQPPYNAMFSAQLEADIKAIVQAGLAGQESRVLVTYQASLTYSQTISVTLSGYLQDPGGPLADLTGDDISEARLVIALNLGWAKFDDPGATQAWPDALDALIGQALELLKTSQMPVSGGEFSLNLSLTGPAQTRLQLEVDIGAMRTTPELFKAILPSAL